METNEPELTLKKIERELTKVKHKCFGKVKVSRKDPNQRELERLQKRRLIIKIRHSQMTNKTKLTWKWRLLLKRFRKKNMNVR